MRHPSSHLRTAVLFLWQKHPVTKPDIAKMEKSETKLADIIDDMVKEAVETKVVDVRPE